MKYALISPSLRRQPSTRREAQARARAERTQDMYQAYLRGLTLAGVGRLYGLGAERVRQLFFMERLPTRKQGWRPPDGAQLPEWSGTRRQPRG